MPSSRPAPRPIAIARFHPHRSHDIQGPREVCAVGSKAASGRFLGGFLLKGRLDTSGLAGQLEKARKEIGRLKDGTGRSSSTTRRCYTILYYAMLYYTIHPLLTKRFRPCEVEKWFFAHPRDKSFVALGILRTAPRNKIPRNNSE